MIRLLRYRIRLHWRLPRMRGDDPRTGNPNLLMVQFAPHARG